MCWHVGTLDGMAPLAGLGWAARPGMVVLAPSPADPAVTGTRGRGLQTRFNTGRLLSLQTNLQDAGLIQQQGNQMRQFRAGSAP